MSASLYPLADAGNAGEQWQRSLKDDPTAWFGVDISSGVEVRKRCEEEAASNALAGFTSSLRAAVKNAAQPMAWAYHHDGALADVQSIWNSCSGDYQPDITPVLAVVAQFKSPDHDEFASALSGTLQLLQSDPATAYKYDGQISDDEILDYLDSDQRFDDAHELKRQFTRSPTTTVNAGFWEDEPAPTTAAAVQAPAKPSLLALLTATGMTKADIAKLTGFTRAYIGQIANGTSRWPGLRPNQIAALRAELKSRYGAVQQCYEAMDDPKQCLPEDNSK